MIVYKQCATDETALTHSCSPCLDAEFGRVRSVCLIEEGTVIAIPFDLAAWTASVEAGDIISNTHKDIEAFKKNPLEDTISAMIILERWNTVGGLKPVS